MFQASLGTASPTRSRADFWPLKTEGKEANVGGLSGCGRVRYLAYARTAPALNPLLFGQAALSPGSPGTAARVAIDVRHTGHTPGIKSDAKLLLTDVAAVP